MRIARTKPRILRTKRKAITRSQVTRLFNLALIKARAKGDPRTNMLQKAAPHQREQLLRSMSILTETDIEREFGP